MTDEKKVPITAKLPESLHNQLVEAINKNICKDKTDGIVQALRRFFEDSVIDDAELQRITHELRLKDARISELQKVIQELPDQSEILVLRAREEVLRVLLDEKDRRIEGFEREISRMENIVNTLDMYAHYFKNRDLVQSNTEVIPCNTVSEGLIKKKCKNCGNTFFTGNNRKEYCSGKCKTAFGRKKN